MSEPSQNEAYTNFALSSPDELAREIQSTNSVQDIASKEEAFVETSEDRSLIEHRAYVHLQGLEDHYKHKIHWSRFVMVIMSIIVIFQCALLWCVGIGRWDFKDYKWLLPALLVQNLAQIVGLALVIVKSLFKDMADN